jgi:hypothetical protein
MRSYVKAELKGGDSHSESRVSEGKRSHGRGRGSQGEP